MVVRSHTNIRRDEAEQIAQEVYDNPDDWRTRGIDNVAKGFTDFARKYRDHGVPDRKHRGHAVGELIAAYARLTAAKAPERFRDKAGVPSVMKFRDPGTAFEFAHQAYLQPESRIAKIDQELTGDNHRITLEASFAYSTDDAHATVAYQEVLTAAHVGDEEWLKRASRAYAYPVDFPAVTGYMTVLLFLVICRPSPFSSGK